MSQAKEAFEIAIGDATSLMARFDEVKRTEPQESAEVLKRASLILAATAWETYVEDRLREGVAAARGNADGTESGIVAKLEKVIRFIRNAVESTDAALAAPMPTVSKSAVAAG